MISIPLDYGELAKMYIEVLNERDRWKTLYYSEVKMSNEVLCELEKEKSK